MRSPGTRNTTFHHADPLGELQDSRTIREGTRFMRNTMASRIWGFAVIMLFAQAITPSSGAAEAYRLAPIDAKDPVPGLRRRWIDPIPALRTIDYSLTYIHHEEFPAGTCREYPVSEMVLGDTTGDSRLVRIDTSGAIKVICDGQTLYINDEVTDVVGTLDDGSTKSVTYMKLPRETCWAYRQGYALLTRYRRAGGSPSTDKVTTESVFRRLIWAEAVVIDVKMLMGWESLDEWLSTMPPKPYEILEVPHKWTIKYEMPQGKLRFRVEEEYDTVLGRMTSSTSFAKDASGQYSIFGGRREDCWISSGRYSYRASSRVYNSGSHHEPKLILETKMDPPMVNRPDVRIPAFVQGFPFVDKTVHPSVEIDGQLKRWERAKKAGRLEVAPERKP